MTLLVNDLSELAFSEEDIVIILVNLLDNAIEACEKLDSRRVIQFKDDAGDRAADSLDSQSRERAGGY